MTASAAPRRRATVGKAEAAAAAVPAGILAVDIGGTHLKFCTPEHREPVKVTSGPNFTPGKMAEAIRAHTAGWNYDRVSLGYPGLVVGDKPLVEPHNLAPGWVGFDYRGAFDNRPLRILNDAAMQALGSDNGGRMLFLGLGTGLGAAIVIDHVVTATELGHVPWKKGRSYEELLGRAALKRDGRKRWAKNVAKAVEHLGALLEADYVVLGGGNAELIDPLPPKTVLGSNDHAFKGGFMLWSAQHSSSR